MKNLASPGPDGLYGCCLKYGGIFIEHALIEIFSESFDSEYVLNQTRIS